MICIPAFCKTSGEFIRRGGEEEPEGYETCTQLLVSDRLNRDNSFTLEETALECFVNGFKMVIRKCTSKTSV